MSNHVYKHIELTGTSSTSIEDAVNNAVASAAKTVRNMRWLEITDTRAHIDGSLVNQWQVSIRVAFTVDP